MLNLLIDETGRLQKVINPCNTRSQPRDEQGRNMRKSYCWRARHARHLLNEDATKSSRRTASVSWLDNSPNKICFSTTLILIDFLPVSLVHITAKQAYVSYGWQFVLPRLMKNVLQHEILAYFFLFHNSGCACAIRTFVNVSVCLTAFERSKDTDDNATYRLS